MVVDYEKAWIRLQAEIAGKSQHGREGLLRAMAQIAAECRVPEGEKARLLRLYGVEVDRLSAETDRDEPDDFEAGLASAADVGLPGHHGPNGGHDGGCSNGRARAG